MKSKKFLRDGMLLGFKSKCYGMIGSYLYDKEQGIKKDKAKLFELCAKESSIVLTLLSIDLSLENDKNEIERVATEYAKIEMEILETISGL